jgi:hypothetical protein
MKAIVVLFTLLLALAPRVALAAAAGVTDSVRGCVDRIPEGGAKPVIAEKFPERGLSGYAATLEVTVEHGKGESVLPGGLELQSSGDAASALKSAGFQIPNQDGGAGARLQTSAPDAKRGDRVTTILELPLLLLPLEPGRHTLVLPPLPIAVQRANNDVAVVCTRAHTIIVEDPISSTPNAQPKLNPPPRPQREEWRSLEHALEWGAAGVVVGGLLAYALYRFRKLRSRSSTRSATRGCSRRLASVSTSTESTTSCGRTSGRATASTASNRRATKSSRRSKSSSTSRFP